MNSANLQLAEGLVTPTYIQQGGQAIARRQSLVKALLSNRRLPAEGWDDATIEMFIQDLARMDSNNFLDNVGMGEREARCASALVQRRHFGLAHGIGRSGSLTDEQPKAAGSTLVAKLTNLMVKDALHLAGLTDVAAVTVLPVATGMALTLTLMALKRNRPPTARYVLWARIDQKTCVKAVLAAGLELVVASNVVEGDQVRTDVDGIARDIERLGADRVCCVVTTTSCFAPRATDLVDEVAKLCRRMGVGHIINNAYGVQSAEICRAISRAWRRGRVDAVVQSTDKNFMVPVGGAVVAAGPSDKSLVEAVNNSYPGRASISPLLDVFITLLSLGAQGWKKLLEEREVVYRHLHRRLTEVALSQGERLLSTPDNPISLALSLATLEARLSPPTSYMPPPGMSYAPPPGTPPPDASPPSAEPTASDLEISGADDAGSGRGPDAEREERKEGEQDETGPHEAGAHGPGAHGAGAHELGAHEAGAHGPPRVRSGLENGEMERGGEGGEGRDGCRDGGEGVKGERRGGGGEGEGEGEKSVEGDRVGRDVAQGLTFFGSMLFARCVSGCRVVVRGERKSVGGISFNGYGSSHGSYPCSYLTAAASIGTTIADVDEFARRLDKCFQEFRKKKKLNS